MDEAAAQIAKAIEDAVKQVIRATYLERLTDTLLFCKGMSKEDEDTKRKFMEMVHKCVYGVEEGEYEIQ